MRSEVCQNQKLHKNEKPRSRVKKKKKGRQEKEIKTEFGAVVAGRQKLFENRKSQKPFAKGNNLI